ncbi:hypothetical protein HYS91_00975 [Candidatus Daviesbacteria bacterium]|nr:hypothetical protein [Candidatus Daviesbacteria bacterium]
MYGRDHDSQGYDVFYGGGNIDPTLTGQFQADIRAHEAAILRKEIAATDLWRGSID